MKTLTIRQPWAELIVSGRRLFEIRTWKSDYQGWILIHAGRKVDDEACRRLNMSSGTLALGAIVGRVCIEDYLEFTEESWQKLRPEHKEWTDYKPGLIGWRLSGAVKFVKPIPWAGSLGLFEVPDNVIPDAAPQEQAVMPWA